jgi:glycerol kinase
MKYLLAIDQGTTGTTAVLVDTKSYKIVAKENKEFPQIFPAPGKVEHNLNDIWETVETTVGQALKSAQIETSDIIAIGITNQRETTCPFDKSGKPLHNALVWQDRRTGSFCENLKSTGKEELIKKKTGLPVDPYFSGSKINWLLNNSDEVKEALKNDNLLIGTIDSFLLYRLTGCESFFTEGSNASRTMLYNIHKGEWDNELCEVMEVPKSILPKVKNSFDDFGKTKGLSFLPDGIPITGILGDQQSALFGQAGTQKGDLKCTYGTGAFILLNTGEEPFDSKNGLITTIAYQKDGKSFYALEGSSYIAGAAVQWLRDNLNLFPNSPDVEDMALEVKDLSEMENILFFPFFTGLGSPYWKSEAKAAIVGLTRDTNNHHLSLACLDGICLSIEDLIRSMRVDSGLEIKTLKVDGGAVSNDLLMEIQATISSTQIIRPKVIETTAFGACLAAAIGAKLIDFEKMNNLWKEDKIFHPSKEKVAHYKRKKDQWSETINKLYL